jgi:hypothetical protein
MASKSKKPNARSTLDAAGKNRLSNIRSGPSGKKNGNRYTKEDKAWFIEQVRLGNNAFMVGSVLGASRATVRRWMRDIGESFSVAAPDEDLTTQEISQRLSGRSLVSTKSGEVIYGDPIRNPEYLANEAAQKAWREFGYFRRRYFNRRHIPWQIEMVQILMAWWESGQKVKGTESSTVVKGIVNTPPGGGKTTTISHDFPAWIIARDRDVRIALGSRTTPQAEKYSRRLRNTLERNPLLNVEFGRFKPLVPDKWAVGEYIVDGVLGKPPSIEYKLALAGFDPDDKKVRRRLKDPDDEIHQTLEALGEVFLTGEKEPTVMALSQEMGFLGGRFDLNLWDDLCDKKNSKTPEQREELVEWWFAEAESRCEPGGIVGLIGTRFGKYDLFRHCRELEYSADDEVEAEVIKASHGGMSEEELAEIREDIERELVDTYGKNISELATPHQDGMTTTRRVYHYYRFQAHDETKCKHPNSLKNSDHIDCVLDPKRFSFRHLNSVRASNQRKFLLTYQQEDESGEDGLVKPIWLTGGKGGDGIEYPGCYNYNRRMLEIPEYLKKSDCYSIATVDPSSQNWWAIQWWIYDYKSDTDYLIDILRARLTSGGFLDWNIRSDKFDGVMHRWQKRSMDMGWPIAPWIVEANATQRYLYQHVWVKEWTKLHRTLILPHETYRNKADEEFGIETLGPRYMHGLVDLPYHQGDLKTRVKVDELKAELVDWPDYPTDDMVSSNWFLHFNRYRLPKSLLVSERSGSKEKSKRHPYENDMPEYLRNEDERRPRREMTTTSVGHRNAQYRRRSA